MSQTAEELLPEEILNMAVKSSNELGWKLDDIPSVVLACEKLGFAILGGQVQFLFEDGTCELYWLSVNPKERISGESWLEYSQRSCSEFLRLFEELVERTEFEKEGLDWLFIRAKKESGIDILQHLCFIMYPVTETEYLELLSKND